MYLSREEEAIYQGERGETLARMMEILVALGDIYGAEWLVPVRSVQIAGVSYKNIGQAGLEWISDLEGKVAVPSILNPAGMDLCRWREMGIDEDFANKQQQVIEAYRKLGVSIDCTCTPYQIYDSLASPGDHLAWSESSAVSYANSVIGARTNREGGPSALAAALDSIRVHGKGAHKYDNARIGINGRIDTLQAAILLVKLGVFPGEIVARLSEQDAGVRCVRNDHPTVKPLGIAEYLARLLLPPEEYRDTATLLVPFAGTGSEIIGAWQAGWRNIIGVEMSEHACEIARFRVAHWCSGRLL